MILNSHADICGHMTMYNLVRAKNRFQISRQNYHL
jgi:hypothetical protein